MIKKLAACIVAAIILTSCGSNDDAETLRAVKVFEVTQQSQGQSRQISGILKARDEADLSFQVGGNVVSVDVKAGDRVKAGQLLASIDPRPFELNVDAAKAEVIKTQAIVTDKQLDYQAKSKLYEDRYVAKTVVDSALADLESAKQNLESAKARLKLAERDLNHAKLTAPFNGQIATRNVEPAMNVSAGQVVMQIVGETGLDVVLALPENLRRHVSVGMPVAVNFPSQKGFKTTGKISEIAATAKEGNAFSTKIVLDDTTGLYPGLSAEVTFDYKANPDEAAYLVPATALAPGDDSSLHYVFIFDPETQTLHKTPVKARNVRENLVEITEGVQPGEWVVTAGVHFLYDGQKVKRYQEP